MRVPEMTSHGLGERRPAAGHQERRQPKERKGTTHLALLLTSLAMFSDCPLPRGRASEAVSSTSDEEPVGACCAEQLCLATVVEAECLAVGGQWFAGFDCRDFLCPMTLQTVPERCDVAYVIPALPFCVTFCNAAAQADGPAGSCNGPGTSRMANDVWFTWTAPTDGALRLSLRYAYNGLTVMYEGANCDDLSELQCLNAHGQSSDDFDELTFEVTAGNRYWLQIGDWGINPGGGTTLLWLRSPVAHCPGDMNCDGSVTFADIDAFVEALSGRENWTHDPCPWSNGDCSGDGEVTFADIDGFVTRIGTTCPE